MATIKLTEIRKENKENKSSVKGCIKFLYGGEGKQTKKLLAKYGDKATVFMLAERIEKDMRIGEQAVNKAGEKRVSKSGNAIMVKVSVDLVSRWFVSNQDKAAEIVAEVKAENENNNEENKKNNNKKQVENAAA